MSNPSSGGLKTVGVQFVAANAQDFAKQLNEIVTIYSRLARAAPDLVSAIKASNLPLDEQEAILKLIGNALLETSAKYGILRTATTITKKSVDEMLGSLKELSRVQGVAGGAVKTPTGQVEQTDLATRLAEQKEYLALQKQIQESDLLAAKQRAAQYALEQKQIEQTDILRRASNQQSFIENQRIAQSEIQLAITNGEYTKALELNAIEQKKAVGDAQRLLQLRVQQAQIEKQISGRPPNPLQEARGARDALFAFGLALNLVISELGSQLPDAAKQAASSIKVVADTMLAGAYFGGAAGAAIGALAGVLLSVGVSALSIDPKIKALNDSLDKLGKKDDAAQGLAKLAHISDANAEAALTYLKANAQLGDSFKSQVDAAQPVIPVLQGIGDLVRSSSSAYQDYNSAVESVIPGVKGLHDLLGRLPRDFEENAIRIEAFKDATLQGKSAQEAMAIASQAVADAFSKQGRETQKLTAIVQAYADAQNEINSITSSVAIQKAQESIDKLKLEGASVDELRLAYLKLIQEKEKLSGPTPSFNGARAYAPSPIGIPQADQARNAAENDRNFLNDTASKLYKDLLSAQHQYNVDSANLWDEHSQRIAEIEANGGEQLARINRDYLQRVKDINDQYAQDTRDAYTDYQTRLGDIQDRVNQTREDAQKEYNDRRAQNEKDYQDRIAQIQRDYQLALFDIGARLDAKGLVRLRLQRAKEILDAQKSRDKDNENAEKQKKKAEEEAQKTAERERKRLKEEYDKRLRDLEQALVKAQAKTEQDHTDALKDLASSIAKQEKAENDSYARRKKALADDLADRKQKLVDALEELVKLNAKYGKDIIESLKGVLDPSVITDLLVKFGKSLEADIKITVTPFNSNLDTHTGDCPPGYHKDASGQCVPGGSFAEGGYVATRQVATLHANEVVLPLSNPNRTQGLLSQYVMPRIYMPSRGGANGYGGSIGNSLDVRIISDSPMFDARVENVSTGVVVRVMKASKR